MRVPRARVVPLKLGTGGRSPAKFNWAFLTDSEQTSANGDVTLTYVR